MLLFLRFLLRTFRLTVFVCISDQVYARLFQDLDRIKIFFAASCHAIYVPVVKHLGRRARGGGSVCLTGLVDAAHNLLPL